MQVQLSCPGHVFPLMQSTFICPARQYLRYIFIFFVLCLCIDNLYAGFGSLHPEELGLTVSKSNRLYLVFLSLFSSICLNYLLFFVLQIKGNMVCSGFFQPFPCIFMLFSPRAPPRMSNVMSVPIHVRPNRHPEY